MSQTKTKNKKYALYMAFFFTYMFVGLFAILGFEGEYNEPFYFAFKWLSVPCAIICYCAIRWEHKQSKIKPLGVFYTLFCFCVLVGYGGGYLVLINNNIGAQEQIQLVGHVVIKRANSGKYKPSYYITVQLNSGKTIEFAVKNTQYIGYHLNQPYNAKWHRGSLGLWYR